MHRKWHGTAHAGRARATCLHAAASYGHHELLRFLIARPGVNLNCGDEDGDTPLHVVEDVESCRMLLAAGADASVRNGDGLSPAGNARGEGRDAIADLLAQAHPAAAAADDASVIAARREAAADGDEAMEKPSVAQSTVRGRRWCPCGREQQQAGACVKTTMFDSLSSRRTGKRPEPSSSSHVVWLSSSSINRGGSSDGSVRKEFMEPIDPLVWGREGI